jgi:hypothetical protein
MKCFGVKSKEILLDLSMKCFGVFMDTKKEVMSLGD